MSDARDSLEAFEERHAALVSLLLNLPSYVAACAAVSLIREDSRLFNSLGSIIGWAIVLSPFLTGGAVAHAIWAGRVGRVGKRSLNVVRATTALGVVAVGVAVCVLLVAFAL